MPRRSRVTGNEEPERERAPVKVAPTAQTLKSALCPVCGRTIPEFRAIKVGYVTIDRINYFGSIEWDPNKAFGVKYRAGGRGSFQDTEPIKPEDAPELFNAVKKRLIDALHEWIQKGWITEEELNQPK